VWDKAVTYGRQAGIRTHDRAAFRTAATYYEQALEALGHLPDTPDTRGLAIEIRLDLGRVLLHLGEYARGLALLREDEALTRAYDDQARLALVLARLTGLLRWRAEFAGAIAAGQEALALATVRGDLALQVEATFYLGQTYWSLGDYGRAAEIFRRNVEALEPGMGRPDRQILSQAWLAFTLSHLGQFAEGRYQGEEALRHATAEGRSDEPMVATCYLGRLYLAQGDLEAAIRVLDQSLVLCRAADNWNVGRGTAAGLGYAYALVGRLAEGRALLDEALRESHRSGALHAQSGFVAWLSAVWLLAGDVDEAMQQAHQALALSRQHGERGFEAEALCQLGAVHAQADPPEVAQSEARYREALTLAEARGMRPLQAHCHHGLGTLYAQLGQGEQARAALTAAIDLYRAMDMTFWLPQAEATLAQVGGG
jgi:tetratricopeptide (TPR) repeat protein